MQLLFDRLRGEILLRISIAFSFLYPPLAALYDPTSWVGYLPRFLTDVLPVSATVFLHIFGILEIIIALWLLFARDVRIPALMASAILILITILNFNQLDVLFRDISLAIAALALAAYVRERMQI